jgi:two-component sensor histidine kinase
MESWNSLGRLRSQVATSAMHLADVSAGTVLFERVTKSVMTRTDGRDVTSTALSLRSLQPDKPDRQFNVLQLALQAALERERVLIEEKIELARRHSILSEEFEHRLMNGLQLVASILTLQSRTMPSPDAAEQLLLAARRVSALGRIHRQLHYLDHRVDVKFKDHISQLCQDLSDLLLQQDVDRQIVLEGAEATIPTHLAIPLGFIVNELITNAVKYGTGNIVVRLATHSVSVVDEGRGLPPDFDPAQSKGLGMKIVRSFASQIAGKLQVSPDISGQRRFLAVSF